MKYKNNILLLLILTSFFSSQLIAADKPIIGLTAAFKDNKIQLSNDYVAAVIENGGIPIILPPTDNEEIIEHYIESIDAAVFTGGKDIPPEYYDQKVHPTVKVMDNLRFNFEKRFISRFLKSKKPALGICLGMQFANVAMGGSMYQDIPSMIGTKVCHRNGQIYTNFHPVGISKSSRLEKILGSTSENVISRHHQAVDRLGKNLRVVGRASDGVIEAIERTDGPFGIFVQWHPESMKKANKNHRDNIFRALIKAAKK